MTSKNYTQVLIGGKIYTLGGYESEEYLQRVAGYLNGKISEIKTLDGYQRLSPEMKSLLLNLNTADDYFKLKKQADELSDQLAQKDKELYEIKHELVSAQMKLENAQTTVDSLKTEKSEFQQTIAVLETRLDDDAKKKTP